MSSEEDIVTSIQEAQDFCEILYQHVKDVEQQYYTAKEKYKEAKGRLKQLQDAKAAKNTKESIGISNRNLHSEWIDRKFPWEAKIKTILKETFKFDDFRSEQLAAINVTLNKKDVIVVMPTGGGKSLIYQLPALVDEGLTLVVSPLISLIQDQLVALKSFRIKAATLNSGTKKEDSKKIYDQMQDKKSSLRLLYVTPEWLAKSKKFMGVLKKKAEAGILKRVAIDEVHCVSSWGHDFRPDYEYLGIVRTELKKVPFVCLTATATAAVLIDIRETLGLGDSVIITAPFNRPNLFYKVVNKPSTSTEVLNYLENLLKNDYANETGIIYTTTVSDSINIASELKKRNLKVAPYHAQLEPHARESIHSKWQSKVYQAVVATVAFGMGIDKPDVRFVIHHSVPKSMESLYQESGRAGRDGKKADCIVLYNLQDLLKVLAMAFSLRNQKKALSVLSYCLDLKSCRRELIAEHFEQAWNQSHCNKMCDHCNAEEIEIKTYDISGVCKQLHNILSHAEKTTDEKLTLIKLLDAFFQTGPKKYRLDCPNKPVMTRLQAETLIAELLRQDYLQHERGSNLYGSFCYIRKGNSVGSHQIKMVSTQRYPGIPKINDGANNESEPSCKKSKKENSN